ncbi:MULTISPECIES: hypothetical protein [Alphaproteobacteria]|jgi:hypothetical protein|uniref:Uncharacterized protein n=1 Tax=Maricaulis virginensis TaxID=144022 RepID=A0A9W6IQ46_9PROT|nr:hypothetical protein [Maricaulis virginensis]GLK53554.1 hypothetical protein GCM10017621_30620 [Maricaulis virginensis]
MAIERLGEDVLRMPITDPHAAYTRLALIEDLEWCAEELEADWPALSEKLSALIASLPPSLN